MGKRGRGLCNFDLGCLGLGPRACVSGAPSMGLGSPDLMLELRALDLRTRGLRLKVQGSGNKAWSLGCTKLSNSDREDLSVCIHSKKWKMLQLVRLQRRANKGRLVTSS